MLITEEELQEKIEGFLRRKQAQYPELAQRPKRDGLANDVYRPVRITHWGFVTGTGH